MAKYELSLSPEYVAHWGIVEAVREIFQNALDQEACQADNPMFFSYEKQEFEAVGGVTYASGGVLRIGNRDSVLDAKTLLLGVTTKRDDAKTIGQFGEGYKIALLVLARLGKKVTIYNYGKREVWHARLSRSKKYDDAKILIIETDTKFFWQKVPDNNLVFEIQGVSNSEYAKIVESNLKLLEQERQLEVINTHYGRILLDDDMKGKVFVSGLFVNIAKDFKYGYDFKPQYIELDRDRRMVADFDLKWKTSNMWNDSGSSLVIDLAKEGAPDVEYLQNQGSWSRSEKIDKVRDEAYMEFNETYGYDAVPVTTQSELDSMVKTFGDKIRPIVVTPAMKHLVTNSIAYKEAKRDALIPPPPRPEPVEVMTELYYSIYNDASPEALGKAWQALLDSYEWRNKP